MRNRESKLDWCLSKEDRLKKIKPDEALSRKHIEKARHNLRAADFNINGGFDDWAVSQAYYAMYHALLAALFKHGFESKNHACTIAAVEHPISTKKIDLDPQDIAFIKTTEQMKTKDAKSKEILNSLVKRAKEIVERIEVALSV